MSAGEKESSAPPLGTVLVLLLIAAGVAVQHLPLQSTRPAPGNGAKPAEASVRRVDARLWQDPFGAIREHAASKAPAAAPPAERLGALIAPAVRGCRLGILGVTVFGNPYTEYAEQRRRTRFAVVAGLSSLHYYPYDAEKLGYLAFPGREDGVPPIVPFELYIPDENAGIAPSPVLVLWIDEEALVGPNPLERIGRLASRTRPELAELERRCRARGKPLELTWRFVGPTSSDVLNAISAERAGRARSTGGPPPPVNAPCPLVLFTAQATAPVSPSGVTPHARDARKPCSLAHDAIVVRTIGDDPTALRTVAGELALRGVFSAKRARPATVAVISEFDTRYGRDLPAYFAEAAAGQCGGRMRSRGCVVPEVIQYSYMRGLDGALPVKAKSEDADEKESAKPGDAGGRLRLGPEGAPERSEGNAQLDYLRRLADSLLARHQALVAEGRPGIRAIGVLGSDVYDKLLVLQALRPLLPESIYFTLDLDARLLDAAQSQWSRNLVVGSSFGLELDPRLQGRLPPFRDSYQPATYLATVAALGPASPRDLSRRFEDLLATPRVFEIGRTAYPLTKQGAGGGVCGPFALGLCNDLHPPGAASWLSGRRIVAWSAALLSGALLVCMLSGRLRSTVAAHPLAVALGGAAVTGALSLGFWAFDRFILADASQEPFSLLEGISIWPGSLLRLAAFLLASGLIVCGWMRTSARLERIGRDFFGAPVPQPAMAADRASSWRREASDSAPVDVAQLWGEYLHRRAPARTGMRVLRTVLVLLVLCVSLILADRFPETPCRGTLSCTTAKVLLSLGVLSFLTLLALVVRETYLCQRFIRVLYAGPSTWPAQTLAKFGVTTRSARDWLDIKLVGRLTAAIGGLIYGPFAVCFLLLVSRSSLFDQWYLPPGLAAVFGVSLALALTAAVQLRNAAEHARTVALERLSDTRRRLASADTVDEKELREIDTLVREIGELRTGAFRPFSQQPVVRAILLPLGGYGGVAVLEYLSIFAQ